MAKRPIFIPRPDHFPYVNEIVVDFIWYPGFNKSQVQKSIRSLHEAAKKQDVFPILEISTKSEDGVGLSLSAFNLSLCLTDNQTISVECAFQGSKVFQNGGPYSDLYLKNSREAKTDPRLQNSGTLIGFKLLGEDFPLIPETAFYDWLYIKAMWQNKNLSDQVMSFNGFSDIAFNPKKSINCQARSAALYAALCNKSYDIGKIINDRDYYLRLMTGNQTEFPNWQPELPL